MGKQSQKETEMHFKSLLCRLISLSGHQPRAKFADRFICHNMWERCYVTKYAEALEATKHLLQLHLLKERSVWPQVQEGRS